MTICRIGALAGAALAALFLWLMSGREPRWYRMYPEGINR